MDLVAATEAPYVSDLDYPRMPELVLGEARFSRYLMDAQGNRDLACALCIWNQSFAGVLHAQIGVVELAIRNAVDRSLKSRCLIEFGTSEWTSAGLAPKDVDALVHGDISRARSRAHKAHANATHDDVVAQLMWGTWVKLVGSGVTSHATDTQRSLWSSSLHNAFPGLPGDESGRLLLAKRVEFLRRVRNREAHFDNLYAEARNVNKIIGSSCSILRSISSDISNGWLDCAGLRMNARALKSMAPWIWEAA